MFSSISSKIFGFSSKNGLKVFQCRPFSRSASNLERQLFEPTSPHDLHRAGGVATFMRLPLAQNHEKVSLNSGLQYFLGSYWWKLEVFKIKVIKCFSSIFTGACQVPKCSIRS